MTKINRFLKCVYVIYYVFDVIDIIILEKWQLTLL